MEKSCENCSKSYVCKFKPERHTDPSTSTSSTLLFKNIGAADFNRKLYRLYAKYCLSYIKAG